VKPCIRVLMAEDSPTVYQFLMHILLSQPDMKIIGWAKNGKQAVQQTAMLQPDLVLMDLHMPIMNGLEATKAIMSSTPTPILMVTATGDPQDVALSLEALRAGAMALVEKPVGLHHAANQKQTQTLLKMIRALAEVKTVKLRVSPRPIEEVDYQHTCHHKLLAIAASTGGPQALSLIFSALNRTFPMPILLVQHIGGDFSEGFISWLQSCTGLKVLLARQGDIALAGNLYVAGCDSHLGINSYGQLIISDITEIGGFRPSASYLFESAAQAFGKEAMAIILTGMGEDGVSGLKVLRQRNGYIIAQDQQSSIVYGMPKAATEAGVVNEVLSLQGIADRLLHLQQSNQA
jgi:two-component system, chemotaxis family, protein-glutamate methylesterase/glutaminase